MWQTDLAAVLTARGDHVHMAGCRCLKIGLMIELRHEGGDMTICARVMVTELRSGPNAAVGSPHGPVRFSCCVKNNVHFNDGFGILCIHRTAGLGMAPMEDLVGCTRRGNRTRRLHCWRRRVTLYAEDATTTMRRTLLDWTPLLKPTRRPPRHGRKLKSWCARRHDVSIPSLYTWDDMKRCVDKRSACVILHALWTPCLHQQSCGSFLFSLAPFEVL